MSSSEKKPPRSPDPQQEPSKSRTLRSADLIRSIKEYADKLLEDGSTRGDLKILSRTLRELRYAFKVFAPYRHCRKVTIFGSARTKPDAPAYQQAVKLGRAMAEQDWMVITGAGDGIMGAGHEGAGRAHSMGLNILLPFEQSANAVIDGDHKLVHMKYFFTRKLMFVKECDAVVCLPGGFGTIDEGLEVLTLLQTGKHDMVPVVFLDAPGGTYWRALHEFINEQLLQGGMISAEDLHLYKVTDSYEAAVNEILNFYRRYHSMRYVREELVLRLNKELTEEQFDAITAQFSDILAAGTFRQTSALRAERDEPELDDKSRLVFQFNRRNLGRLRQMIDALNSSMPSQS
ncbi:MAG: TIGR00730 family Rossman fold protein [Planctomycetota bacterium]|nr:TIGR00730 family Rossman fold protein [Planctomycetota bacterium]